MSIKKIKQLFRFVKYGIKFDLKQHLKLYVQIWNKWLILFNICVSIKNQSTMHMRQKKKYPIDYTGNPIDARVKETLSQFFVFIVDPMKCRLFIMSSVKFYDINFWNLQLLEHP